MVRVAVFDEGLAVKLGFDQGEDDLLMHLDDMRNYARSAPINVENFAVLPE